VLPCDVACILSAGPYIESVLAKRFQEYSSKRAAQAAAKCATLLNAASQRVHAAANAADATVAGVVAVLDAEVATFLAAAEAGPGTCCSPRLRMSSHLNPVSGMTTP
jgi:hypothetical protein